MVVLPPFMRPVTARDAEMLLPGWAWLFPPEHVPLLLSIMGDWVFAGPSGEHFALSTLEGSYWCVAADSTQFNNLKQSFEWLDENFQAGWQEIAHRSHMIPSSNECLAWKVPPIIGGRFEVANLHVVSQLMHQSVMGQLHQQVQSSARS